MFYFNLLLYGVSVVVIVLSNLELKVFWEVELIEMCNCIKLMCSCLVELLKEKGII